MEGDRLPMGLYYKLMRGSLRLTFPHAKTIFEAEPDGDPAVFVSNHAAITGPVMMTLDFPRAHRAWAVANAMDPEMAKNYAFHDVLLGRSRKHQGFYRFLSGIIARMLPPLLTGSDTIPVFHDKNIVSTFKQSVKTLVEGKDLVIFAEAPARFSTYVNELQPGFVDVARLYYRKTKKRLKFYPVYLNKKLAVISVGAPIAYDPDRSLDEQRQTIAAYLRDNIDRLARQLPAHTPMPFMSDRWYGAYSEFEYDAPGYWRMITEGK